MEGVTDLQTGACGSAGERIRGNRLSGLPSLFTERLVRCPTLAEWFVFGLGKATRAPRLIANNGSAGEPIKVQNANHGPAAIKRCLPDLTRRIIGPRSKAVRAPLQAVIRRHNPLHVG